jgi:hypothetical protein
MVDEIRTLSRGKSPVRISQIASKTIPIFLLARVLVIAIVTSSFVFVDTETPTQLKRIRGADQLFWIGRPQKPT